MAPSTARATRSAKVRCVPMGDALVAAPQAPQVTLRGGFEAGVKRLGWRLPGSGSRRLRATRRPAARRQPPPPPQAEKAKSPPNPKRDAVAGAVARAASQSTIHPLDTIKVRMQAGTFGSSVSKFGKLVPPKGLGDAVVGAASLYRGVAGAATGAGIAIGTYFAMYSAAKGGLEKHCKKMNPAAVAFAAGAVAAAGSSFVKVPLAVCIRSVQAGVYPNVFRASSRIVRAAGVRGLFTGFVPTFLEDVPDMAVKFAAYETLRGLHRQLHNGAASTAQEDLVMGGVAGSLAAASTTPLDVIKTRMMCTAASNPSVLGATRSIMRGGGGLSAFFTGVGPRALSNGVNTAVFFCFYEAIRSSLEAMEAKRSIGAAASPSAGQAAGQGGAQGTALRTAPVDLSAPREAEELDLVFEEGLQPMIGASITNTTISQQNMRKRQQGNRSARRA